MAMFLPPLAAHLAKVAAKDVGRYAMTGIRVVDPGNGTYRLEATDGRRAAILRGNSLSPDLVPELPQADESALASEGIIPTSDWEDGFKMVPKKGPTGQEMPLALVLGKKGVGMATFGKLCQAPLLDGRFPNIDDVLPKGPAKLTFSVSAAYMIGLLQVARAVLGDEHRVDIHFWKDGAPVGITCHTSEHGGVFFDGLIMPLS